MCALPQLLATPETKKATRRRPDPLDFAGVPTGIRTPVSTVKGWCPRPLDDGDEAQNP